MSIRIVADCVALSCQITEMLKRAKTARKPTSGYYFYTVEKEWYSLMDMASRLFDADEI
ncbi:MAG: hypothetical protein ACOXZJ_06405 [Bacteroidales bacterium]